MQWARIADECAAADLIVCDLSTHAELALRLLASAGASDRRTCLTCIGISTPLVWARTPPRFESAAVPCETEPQAAATHERGTASSGASDGEVSAATATAKQDLEEDARASTTSQSSAARDAPPQRAPHTAVDCAVRAASPDAQAVRQTEELFMQRHTPGHMRTHVICPGVLYGHGESPAGFLARFREAWQGGDAVALPVAGDGGNVLPTLHVADLASGIVALARSDLDSRYLVLCDDANDTQLDVVQCISSKLGCGNVDRATTAWPALEEVRARPLVTWLYTVAA